MDKKFLVIQTAFIGDVILATGVLEKLHRFYPGAAIDFMVRKGNETLLTGHPFLRRVLVWDKKKNKYRNLLKLLHQVRRERYDAVINIQRFAATGMLTAFSNAGETVGFDKNPWSFAFSKHIPHVVNSDAQGQTLHEIERNNQLVEHLTDAVADKPKLYPSADDYTSVEQFKTQPYICVAPASVWFTKQYPKEKWISFIQKLTPWLPVYLIGAPTDRQLCDEIVQQSGHANALNLAGQLSFLQSAALLKDAQMNYVNDSAPMHLASAVNAPVTAIYCSTVNTFGFGPLSDKSFVAETRLPLDCRPCGLHGHAACPQGHFKCALTIEDEQLLEKLG
ncbi:glycosyltransferase family 9 protein [Foetidibacter luteolus]|uniref:glycosyltransferase family 9 protein n=1 Tax=Foetidibacter luteolus TaxID=2608880 RepID=UPI00129B8064|nr:glycosyltransferase family 9 protein [Foetidibacter luteolus]